MPDVFTKAKRAEVMSLIRGRGNKDTELKLIKIFRSHRIRGWRRGMLLFGRPDFAFPKVKLAVFVDGCFWHGCPLHHTNPRTNEIFWRKKYAANRKRDLLVIRTLHAKGWNVLRIWEHDLTRERVPSVVSRIERALSA